MTIQRKAGGMMKKKPKRNFQTEYISRVLESDRQAGMELVKLNVETQGWRKK